jgi:quercetin dioxygenase-like cupin family protein
MTPRAARIRWEEIALDTVTEMVSRKQVAGEALSVVQVYFKKGTIVPEHRHDAERLVYVLQGAMRVVVDGHEHTTREGEVLILPGGSLHHAESLDDTFVIVFGERPRLNEFVRPCHPGGR